MYLFPHGCGQRKKKALHKQTNLKSEVGSCRRLYPWSLQKKVHLLDISAQFFSKVPFGNLKSQRLLFSWIIMLSGKKKLSETRCEYYCDYFCFSLQQYKNNLIKHHQKLSIRVNFGFLNLSGDISSSFFDSCNRIFSSWVLLVKIFFDVLHLVKMKKGLMNYTDVISFYLRNIMSITNIIDLEWVK